MKENFWPIVLSTILGFLCFSVLATCSLKRGDLAAANNESANIAVTSVQPLQVAATSEPERGLAQMPPPNLGFDIKYIYRRKTESNFNTLTDNTVLHSGDYYKIIFTPTEETYVYIFQQGSSGNIFRLFPMASETVNNTNPAQPGTEYHVPAQDKSFFLDNQTGTEKLYFITSRQKDEVLENQYQQILVARSGKYADRTRTAQAALTRSIKMRDPGGIESDATQTETFTVSDNDGKQFSVIRDRLKSCDGCRSEVTFQHK